MENGERETRNSGVYYPENNERELFFFFFVLKAQFWKTWVKVSFTDFRFFLFSLFFQYSLGRKYKAFSIYYILLEKVIIKLKGKLTNIKIAKKINIIFQYNWFLIYFSL